MLEISRGKLFAILSFFVALTLLSYFHRYPTGDDAWLGEQAFWLQKSGIIRSEFFRGLLGCEKQIFVSHKLFLIFGAGMIRLFGYHLPVLQFVGLIFFFVVIFQLVFYVSKRQGALSSWYVLAVLVLIFSNRLLIKMSFENRPEMMVAALGFGCFLYLAPEKITNRKVVLAGLLAGLAFLCHLNGVIYLIAGFFTLMYCKEYRRAFFFGFAGGLISLFYFADILNIENGFVAWYVQFSGDPMTKESFRLSTKVLQYLTYPILFFKSPEQLALSLLLVFLLWHQRSYTGLIPQKLKVFSLTLFISFWLITKSNSSVYMLVFMPFMLILVYELYRAKPFRNTALKTVLAAYVVIGTFG
ncbi:hypothetical protein, partial [Dyadobacter sp.]|uniref:hypothetical protein n=1 Tax=Dyadobacter sp. TaxID=1914288 RepID=UPI003F6F5684